TLQASAHTPAMKSDCHQGLLPFHRVRAGACFCARQGTRSVVWSFQISDEERRLAQKQARPFGLRGKCRHAALRDLAREPPLPASRALPGDICRGNADCAETATDPSVWDRYATAASRVAVASHRKRRQPARRLPASSPWRCRSHMSAPVSGPGEPACTSYQDADASCATWVT